MRRLRILFLALLAIAVAAVSGAGKARADAFGESVAKLAAGGFSTTGTVVEELTAGGDDRAVAVLEALQAGNLYIRKSDQGVFIARGSGRELTLIDPATGQETGTSAADALEKIRVNNKLRRTIRASLGSLTLLSPDPNRRLAAAEAVFKARDADALPALDAAIEKEIVPAIRKALLEARAAAILTGGGDEAAKKEAVAVLQARGDRDALSLLTAVANEGDSETSRAAAAAVQSIEANLAVWAGAQNVIYGLSLGSVLLLAAIGLAITFGVMGVINMAHGEMVMIGAYTTFVVQEVIRQSAPGLFNYSLFIALPLAFVISGAIGIAIERGIIRWLYGRPLETLLATWGLSLMLQQAVRSIFGPTNREVGNPDWMSGAVDVGALTLTYNRIWIIVFALLVFFALQLLLKKTPFGLQMRAVTQNREMAGAMGIRTGRVDALTFGLGSGIAGIAGVALSQIDNVSPNLGQGYIIDSFMVVVFGGVGNLWGTLVGAMTLGVANKFLEPYAGAVLGKIFVLVFIILFIQKRPRGLFALKGRAVEA
ncbi:MAG: urea ABC transporter permease subunit UrtB [Hyphomicrobiales bacterium]